MKAMIFAAGLGTRLRPLTDNCPKALVEVGGKPMLGHVIDKLLDAGVDGFVINVHHFPHMIVDYVGQFYHDIDVKFSDESRLLLDTGGAILAARHMLDDGEPFIVHNADILTDFSMAEMIERHRASDADATLLMADRKSSRKLAFQDGRLRGWVNLSSGAVLPEGSDLSRCAMLAFGGVHILSPSVFPKLSAHGREVFPIMPFYIENAPFLDIRSFTPSDSFNWFDIGSPEKLAAARHFINLRS